MSRKRIVAALLLVFVFSLGAACYLQFTSANGSGVALATAAEPASGGDLEPIGVIEGASEALHLAALAPTRDAPAAAQPASDTEEASVAPSEDEDSTVTLESVDMPATSMVLASAADSSGSQPRTASLRLANVVGLSGGGGGAAGPTGGSGTQNEEPPKNNEDPPQNEEPQQNGEVEGEGKEGEYPPDPYNPPVDPPPYYDDELDPPHGQDPVSVPEPGTLVLLGAGLAALGLGRRRKNRQ